MFYLFNLFETGTAYCHCQHAHNDKPPVGVAQSKFRVNLDTALLFTILIPDEAIQVNIILNIYICFAGILVCKIHKSCRDWSSINQDAKHPAQSIPQRTVHLSNKSNFEKSVFVATWSCNKRTVENWSLQIIISFVSDDNVPHYTAPKIVASLTMFLFPNGKSKHYYFLSALEASKQLHLTSPLLCLDSKAFLISQTARSIMTAYDRRVQISASSRSRYIIPAPDSHAHSGLR